MTLEAETHPLSTLCYIWNSKIRVTTEHIFMYCLDEYLQVKRLMQEGDPAKISDAGTLLIQCIDSVRDIDKAFHDTVLSLVVKRLHENEINVETILTAYGGKTSDDIRLRRFTIGDIVDAFIRYVEERREDALPRRLMSEAVSEEHLLDIARGIVLSAVVSAYDILLAPLEARRSAGLLFLPLPPEQETTSNIVLLQGRTRRGRRGRRRTFRHSF